MSLDVYLSMTLDVGRPPLRDGSIDLETVEFFSRNITHNLGKMADEAGLYEACWRPNENGIMEAKQLIPVLESGLARLLEGEDYYKQFSPKNGWGNYNVLVRFVETYLEACKKYPNAEVSVWR